MAKEVKGPQKEAGRVLFVEDFATGGRQGQEENTSLSL